MVYKSIEMTTKNEVSKAWRELGCLAIKITTKSQVGERWRKVVNNSIKTSSKNEVSEGRLFVGRLKSNAKLRWVRYGGRSLHTRMKRR